MYGLPADVDLSFLEGAQLLQLCVGENELILNLHEGISIMVASTIRVGAATYDDSRAAAQALFPLLGDSVGGASGSPDGTLTLAWSRGEVVEILDSSREYESYTISGGGSTIVV